MITPLLYLWLSTVYVAAVVTVVLLWNSRHRVEAGAGDEGYVGRHRTDLQPTPAFDWQADFEARIAANLAEKKALIAAVKEPTQEMFVPDFDGVVGEHERGSTHYRRLSPVALRLAAGRVRRSTYGTPAVADVWADEMANVT